MADGAGWGATTFTSALRVTPTRSWRTIVMPPTVVAITNIPNRMAHARAIRSSTMARIIRHPPADQLGPYHDADMFNKCLRCRLPDVGTPPAPALGRSHLYRIDQRPITHVDERLFDRLDRSIVGAQGDGGFRVSSNRPQPRPACGPYSEFLCSKDFDGPGAAINLLCENIEPLRARWTNFAKYGLLQLTNKCHR